MAGNVDQSCGQPSIKDTARPKAFSQAFRKREDMVANRNSLEGLVNGQDVMQQVHGEPV